MMYTLILSLALGHPVVCRAIPPTRTTNDYSTFVIAESNTMGKTVIVEDEPCVPG